MVVVAYFRTGPTTGADVLGFSEPSPEYAAVIEWPPADSAVVENTAVPPFTATVPIRQAAVQELNRPRRGPRKRGVEELFLFFGGEGQGILPPS